MRLKKHTVLGALAATALSGSWTRVYGAALGREALQVSRADDGAGSLQAGAWDEVLAAADMQKRNIVFGGSGTATTTSSGPAESATESSTATTSSNGTATNNGAANATTSSPTYELALDDDDGPSPLRFLYLIFLVAGLVVVGIAVRIYFVKKRRRQRLEQRDMVRVAALRRDLEQQRGSDTHSGSGSGSGGGPRTPEMTERDTSIDGEYFQPPPPYPHASSKLPIYEEVEEGDEDADRHLGPIHPSSGSASTSPNASGSHSSSDTVADHPSGLAYPQPTYRPDGSRYSRYHDNGLTSLPGPPLASPPSPPHPPPQPSGHASNPFENEPDDHRLPGQNSPSSRDTRPGSTPHETTH